MEVQSSRIEAGRVAMDLPRKCDVVVIGGGPSGSMAGTLLSRKGYDVVLLEKQRHPRYIVGESLIPHFWKYTDMLGATSKIEAESFIKKAGGTHAWHGVIRQLAFKDFGYTRPALHVERYRFDQILLDHAKEQGVRVFEEVAATSVDFDHGEGVTVSYRPAGETKGGQIAARFVVDASGQGAVIAKQLGIRVIDEGFRFMSVWGYFEDSKYVAADGKAHPFSEVRATPPTTFVSSVGELGEWGWSWHIPLRDTTSVGLVVPMDHLKRIKKDEGGLEEYFLRTCYESPYLSRLLEPARFTEGSVRIIRDYAYRPVKLAGPGFFLVGDAAAFIDPIFSIGVVLGMYSATLAAWSIDHTFRDPSQEARTQAIYAGQFERRLEVSRSLALPRYRAVGDASEVARLGFQLQSSMEQELMYVVSVVTTRADNFTEVAHTTQGEAIRSARFRELDEIAF
jgi:flavin-dependent dehydrogenase